MKMYGISVEQHLRAIRQSLIVLEKNLAALDSGPDFTRSVEAEFCAMSLHDHLRDITIWLNGVRNGRHREAAARSGIPAAMDVTGMSPNRTTY